MRKSIFVVLLIGVVFLLSGQQSCDRTGGDTAVGEGPYVGGNDGVSIAFLDDAPPLSGNFQGDPIAIEVELTNNGETRLVANTAVVNLIGTIVGGAFTLTDTDATASNVGLIDRVRDSGDIADSDFVVLGTATLKDSESIGPSWSPNLRAQVCYPYETNVQIDDLCIPGARNEVGTIECEIDNSENLVDSGDVSAAPVQVTSVVETRTGTGIRVRLDIENQGNGDVISVGNTCDNAVNVPLVNRDLVTVNVPGYDCVFRGATGDTGQVELRSNKGRLRCTKDTGGTGRAYEDRFVATLTYNYVEEASKTILIQSKTAGI
ncbi:MAG: hypothetical protein CMH62_03385 [Nanoarchaeota archaeon]|nr:hypothetical protein [Nanoarchaeota archaeon]